MGISPQFKLPVLNVSNKYAKFHERNISAKATGIMQTIVKPRARSELRIRDKLSTSLRQSEMIASKIEKSVRFKRNEKTSKSTPFDSIRRAFSRERAIEKFLDSASDEEFEELFNEELDIGDKSRFSSLTNEIEKNDYIHDDETKEVLYVKFPPWMTSTHGLSRPCSPADETIDRYYHLLNHCVNVSQIAELPQDWVLNMHKQIQKKSLLETHKVYMKTFYQDMHENYFWSLKKAIVDYILKEVEEQERLGIKIKPKVRS